MLARTFQSTTLMTWLNMLVKSSSLLLLTPLAARYFDGQDFALWMTFTTMQSFFLLFDLGLSPTFIRFFAYLSSDKNLQSQQVNGVLFTYNSLLAAQNYFYRVTTIVVCIIGVVSGWYIFFLPGQNSFAENAIKFSQIGLVVAVSIFQLHIIKYGAIAQGLGKLAAWQKFQAYLGMINVIVTVAVLIFTKDLLVVLVGSSVSALIMYLLSARFIATEIESPHFFAQTSAASTNSHSVRKVVFEAGWRSALGILLSQGLILLSGILYTNLTEPSTLVGYLLLLQIMRASSSFSQPPFYSKIPYLSALYIQGHFSTITENTKRYFLRSLLVYVVISLIGYLFVTYFMSYFGRQSVQINKSLWYLALAAFFVERLGALNLQLYSISNHILWHIANGATGIVMLVLAYFFHSVYGIVAFPLSMLIAYLLFYTPYSMYFSNKLFSSLSISWWRSVYLPSLLSLAVAMAVVWRF